VVAFALHFGHTLGIDWDGHGNDATGRRATTTATATAAESGCRRCCSSWLKPSPVVPASAEATVALAFTRAGDGDGDGGQKAPRRTDSSGQERPEIMNFIGMKPNANLSHSLPSNTAFRFPVADYLISSSFLWTKHCHHSTKLLLNSPKHTNAVTLTETVSHVSLCKRTANRLFFTSIAHT